MESKTTPIVLVAGSSGNPGHLGHISLFVEAKKFLEQNLGLSKGHVLRLLFYLKRMV